MGSQVAFRVSVMVRVRRVGLVGWVGLKKKKASRWRTQQHPLCELNAIMDITPTGVQLAIKRASPTRAKKKVIIREQSKNGCRTNSTHTFGVGGGVDITSLLGTGGGRR